MSGKSILAIDQGTTSSRAILFSEDGDILDVKQKELSLFYPHKGWVEQDALDIWHDSLWACQNIIKRNQDHDIVTVGITNQRETTIVWDRKTGQPVYNAIVWQDRRTADYCKSLKDKNLEDKVRAKTGLLLDPYFSATKIKWVLDNVDGARARAEAGELAFGTVDSWLIWNLSGGKEHVTDVTNASRTLIYNVVTQKWDKELLEIFDIPASMLPEVKDNVADFCDVKAALGLDIKVQGVAGDQQAAFIGQACFKEGMVKSTYGTGCFMLMNIGDKFKESKNRLLTTIGYRINGKTVYALEGSIFVAGAAIQWLRDNLGFFKDAAESAALATSVDDNNGVYFVPAFTGLGAPYWDPHAKAAITGLSRESNKAHITRAALEAQAYQTFDLIAAMEGDSGFNPQVIRADGGLVNNKFVCGFIASILNKPLDVPKVTETTALGAAYLAALGAGIYNGLDDIVARWQCAHSYAPEMDDSIRKERLDGWKKAIETVLS